MTSDRTDVDFKWEFSTQSYLTTKSMAKLKIFAHQSLFHKLCKNSKFSSWSSLKNLFTFLCTFKVYFHHYIIYYIKMKVCVYVCVYVCPAACRRTYTTYHPEIWRGLLISPGLGTEPGGDPKF